MSQKLVVAVAGGTGKQGGAVVKSLLEKGHTWGYQPYHVWHPAGSWRL